MSVFLLMGATEPCSHMFHCLSGASVDVLAKKKSRTNETDSATVLPFFPPEEIGTGNLFVFK